MPVVGSCGSRNYHPNYLTQLTHQWGLHAYLEYNISYIYHVMYAYFDRDKILNPKPSLMIKELPS